MHTDVLRTTDDYTLHAYVCRIELSTSSQPETHYVGDESGQDNWKYIELERRSETLPCSKAPSRSDKLNTTYAYEQVYYHYTYKSPYNYYLHKYLNYSRARIFLPPAQDEVCIADLALLYVSWVGGYGANATNHSSFSSSFHPNHSSPSSRHMSI